MAKKISSKEVLLMTVFQHKLKYSSDQDKRLKQNNPLINICAVSQIESQLKERLVKAKLLRDKLLREGLLEEKLLRKELPREGLLREKLLREKLLREE